LQVYQYSGFQSFVDDNNPGRRNQDHPQK